MDTLAFKLLWRLILYSALLYVLFSFLFFYLYAHPKRYVSWFTPASRGLKFEKVKLTAADGVKLDAWFIPNERSKKAVIVCHGYPIDKGNVYGMTSFLPDNFNVLLFDFRAMGESEGFFSSGGTRELKDLDAAFAFLREKGFKKAGLFGFSMGAATVLMTRNPAAAAVVADSPFADIGGVLDNVFRGLGVFRHPLIRLMKLWSVLILGADTDRVSPIATIPGLKIPALIMHGDRDTQVPATASHRLKAANPGVELWLIKGADHGETHETAGAEYEKKVTGFFQKHL